MGISFQVAKYSLEFGINVKKVMFEEVRFTNTKSGVHSLVMPMQLPT